MKHAIVLKSVNVVLAVVVVAVLLGCGGDPMDPPKGSTEEKMCGDWLSDPLPPRDGKKGGEDTLMELDVSFWNSGLVLGYTELNVPKNGGTPTPRGQSDRYPVLRCPG
jgi:hypothetical protein